MATQSFDPEMAKVLGMKYWNHFAIQLGHWNPMKVIIMDDEVFRIMPYEVKIELAREMVKYLAEDVMFARDADNDQVWILGPKKTMQHDITVVGNIPIWDPKKKHVTVEVKIPRPPNAYILYRKDKHSEVKAENPSLHNNEISVITGAMWKGEAPEVRAKYHKKALEIKGHLMALHPNYRYSPRKSSEIRRRAPRRPPVEYEHNAHLSPEANNMQAGLVITSNITRRIPGAQRFLPPVVAPGWTPEMPSTAGEASTQDHEDAPEVGMVVDPEYQAVVDAFVDNWDLEADLARILAEI